MSARLVANELDLNLATLAAALLVVIIVVVGGAGAGALDAARLSGRVAIAEVAVVEFRGRFYVVLISDVGHFNRSGITRYKNGKLVEMLF